MSLNDTSTVEATVYEPSDLIVSVVVSCYVLYTVAIVIGIPCNAFVLYRMCRLSKKCADMYSNGVGLCLFVMAIADIGSLCSILMSLNDTSTVEAIVYEPSDLIVSVVVSCYVLYTVAIVIGIPCNAFVLYRMCRLSKKCADMYSNGVGLCLFVMAIADIGSLCSILVHYVLSIHTETQLIADYIGFEAVNAVCKGGCTMRSLFNNQTVNKVFLLIEIVASFVIPTLTIVYVDASVLFGLYFKIGNLKSAELDLRRNVSPRTQRNSYLWRWLFIALIDIGLNAPENLFRLGLILGIIESSDSELFYIYRIVAQVPYYLQFGFNGVYLALFIYDKSTRPARRRVIESASVDTHHLTERQREAQGLVALDQSLCDSGIEDDPCRV
ncbi:hypothetical protein OESDEN_06588 [Oesophagostomum dentatum]|uniref:G-protein coupled receptors family 1 profile domain-containing protein n=1 Tax=Oesophagostomum dentatum TaxID=61180 RepID=A0A0B1TDQ1_OESDE|nr:hypothetical protein OESDEN_06588 [Oesophagostomum dentatum]